MIQLTSDAASVSLYHARSPRVNTWTILDIPNRAGEIGLPHAHRPLHGSTSSLWFGLSFASRPSIIYLAANDCLSATLRWANEGRDFNSLVCVPAERVYCEYKAQKHIHRDVADSRLL